MNEGTAASAAPRVVLDTNVCLDVFVFADARAERLRAALDAGRVRAVTSIACQAEWSAVLAYPTLALDAVRRRAARADHARAHHLIAVSDDVLVLPRCADPDDQKFIALAVAAGASWLLTRDRALLDVGRRMDRAHGCRIGTPEAWAAAQIP